ncbi:hypothetical protein SAMD00079811_50030 [Scytonema sp. HK-05]|nr:hypothetical protein SAMD00079811_50030 [Scytonema sp. HK-05]
MKFINEPQMDTDKLVLHSNEKRYIFIKIYKN